MANWCTACKRTAMAASTEPALTVFAWGNESRGDDAIGAILARKITDLGHPAVEVVEDHQLHLEHVMDIREGVPLLFVDASVALDEGFRLEKLVPERDESISTHSMSPSALLDLYEQTLGQPPPSAWMLHVSGKSFELGEDVSPAANASIEQAWRFLEETLSQPVDQWPARLDAGSSAS